MHPEVWALPSYRPAALPQNSTHRLMDGDLPTRTQKAFAISCHFTEFPVDAASTASAEKGAFFRAEQ